VFAYFGQLGGQTGGTFRATLEYLSESDDGRVVDGREHFFDLYAWDEFWS
jgi:hypothetical protein